MMNNYKKGDIDFNIDYAKWSHEDDAILRGTAKADNLAVGGAYNTVYASGGNDRVSLYSGYALNAVVYGEAGDDFIGTKYSQNPTIYGGKGNDSIRIDVSGAYAEGNEGKDKFILAGDALNLTLDGGDDDDTFWFIESSSGTLTGGTGKNTYHFDPYEYGSGHRNEIVITDLSNEDVIRYNLREANGEELSWKKDSINGYIVLEDADYGNFSITLESVTDISEVAGVTYKSPNKTATLAELFSIQGGGNVSLNTAATAAKILEGYTATTFNASDYGTKIKTIDASAVAQDISIKANGNANKIIGSGGDDTIDAGKGKDTITGGDGSDVFVYSGGNDLITDYNEDDDKIQIASGSISSVAVNGKNVVFTIGKGHITVKGGKGQSITIIDAQGQELVYPDDFNSEPVSINAANTAIKLLDNYEDASFNVEDYGAKLKTINGSAVTYGLEIFGNTLANVIIGTDDDDTIAGDKGNDKLTGGEGSDIFVYNSGDGNDSILDYNEDDDKISIESADVISSASVKGDDFVFTIGKGKLTVKDGADKIINFIDENGDDFTYNPNVKINSAGTAIEILETYSDETFDVADYGSALVTIDASAAQELEILGNDLNNKIIGSDYDNTIQGNAGNDTLTGGDGADIFVYSAGKDVITDYNEDDTIQIANGKISKAKVSGSKVVFTIGKGSLTVNNAKGKELNMIDSSGNSYTTIVGGSTTLTLANSDKSPVTISSAIKIVNAAKRTKAVQITGNKLANSISGGTKNDLIYGGNDNDTILGNAGNDKLYGETGNDLLKGGKGKDSLWGGAGNDTLYGDAGADTFIYASGEGNDIICGFDNTDMLQITGKFSGTYNKSKREVYFKVGSTSKAITLKDFTATSFNVNGDDYHISGKKLIK